MMVNVVVSAGLVVVIEPDVLIANVEQAETTGAIDHCVRGGGHDVLRDSVFEVVPTAPALACYHGTPGRTSQCRCGLQQLYM